ncbi:hypothetical protein [Tepidimicrobium xylanilyticum]|uniref:Uncharacterized protein n=1 Tax=Tepidimicrobium xylanilyticum TaxID=1123352 RepID=A0A1H2Z5V6_9FIRM|nr:hypothetical protein [Tepidimicrobium xylanilyticum]GMG96390.1 hypothetical protein EN5CB1_12160 [Tepidimicrobium xylanilyticum]SDX12715.1 hypothetical protein SAMN05660923_01734 [Tepidimicrobium xylanilyticum]
MKDIRLNNIIFPIWLLLFFPPVIFITLIGNYIIDSLVILACFKIFKLADFHYSMTSFYRKSIVKVWIFGFLADFIGAIILFILGILGDSFGLSNELLSGINYDPFSNIWAVIIILFAILMSGFFIFLFNYRITFKELIEDLSTRFKLALTIAIITMPWTFLLPTKWFYY